VRRLRGAAFLAAALTTLPLGVGLPADFAILISFKKVY
jgi:hypothetical protein